MRLTDMPETWRHMSSQQTICVKPTYVPRRRGRFSQHDQEVVVIENGATGNVDRLPIFVLLTLPVACVGHGVEYDDDTLRDKLIYP